MERTCKQIRDLERLARDTKQEFNYWSDLLAQQSTRYSRQYIEMRLQQAKQNHIAALSKAFG